MNEREILRVLDYMGENLPEPNRAECGTEPICQRPRLSYSRWAADEILNRLLDRPFTQAAETVEEFIVKMAYFLCVAGEAGTAAIFSAAKDTAEEILEAIRDTDRKIYI
jgi:hypothetical protein